MMYLVGGFLPPIWKLYARQIGSFPPGKSGWTYKTYQNIWNHPLGMLDYFTLFRGRMYTKLQGSIEKL